MQELETYLALAREVVLEGLEDVVPRDTTRTGRLYERILDYPMREAKGLRPALAIATCRALGGELDEARGTALSLELFHNAFLIHDDVEDGSELRRHRDTMHREVGIPVAVNVGDGMLALALQPLLGNLEVLGVGRSLAVLELVVQMARNSAEGQAMELEWIREGRWDLVPRDYLRMVHRKTAWYSFIAPIVAGARCAPRVPEQVIRRLGSFAQCLGVAFQVTDDLLNLEGDTATLGKELGGDLWEGKRTWILLHALAHASTDDRARAIEILARPRPGPGASDGRTLIDALFAAGELTAAGHARLLASGHPYGVHHKSVEDVDFLFELVHRTGALAVAREGARRYVARAGRILRGLGPALPPSRHRRFLEAMVEFVVERTR